MGTVTKTIGTSSRDYSTLQAWEDALPANLVTDGNAQVGECYNDSEFTARVSISGQTTDATNNITLRCATGQSFSDNTNKLTNRLAYNASNGVAVRTTTAYASAVIVVTTNNVLIEGLQIKATGTQTWALNASGTANVVRKCILSAVLRNNAGDYVARVSGATSNLIANCLVIADASNGCTGVSVATGASAVNCTVVRPSNRTAGGKAFHAAYNTSTVKNCAIFGFTVSSTGTYASDGHNVTDHTSAPGSTSNITSATYANQFVQSSTGSSVEDFRIVGTGSDLDDAGVTDTTNIPAGDDIVGQTRSTWDVGCWEYVAGGGTSLTANGGTLTLTGGNAILIKSSALTAQGGTLSLTGGNATLAKASSLTAQGGTLSLTGGNATLAKASVLTAQGGTLALTGGDADLTHETAGAYTLTALGGTLSLTGGDAVLTYVSLNVPQHGGSGSRVRRSREFNEFIEGLFKKKTRKQTLQAVVAQAVNEEKLQQGIEFVAEAFRQKHIQRDSALRTELELVETQLRRKLQDLEDEEYAVVSLLL